MAEATVYNPAGPQSNIRNGDVTGANATRLAPVKAGAQVRLNRIQCSNLNGADAVITVAKSDSPNDPVWEQKISALLGVGPPANFHPHAPLSTPGATFLIGCTVPNLDAEWSWDYV